MTIMVSFGSFVGVLTQGETLDIRVRWSTPVVVTGTPFLTLSVVNNMTHVPATAMYDPRLSSSETSVFLYTVGPDEFMSDLGLASATALSTNGGYIRREATTPILNAILTCPTNALTLSDR
jgi:hypothetical protein